MAFVITASYNSTYKSPVAWGDPQKHVGNLLRNTALNFLIKWNEERRPETGFFLLAQDSRPGGAQGR
ncbi:hypothetical protein [Phenylobacterium sp.]|uniref:hypothetical protein n=1 Tax=Phenylobacterium sp. TaxID=1871053 RepID=UPI00301DA1B2